MRFYRNERLRPAPWVRSIPQISTPRITGLAPFSDASEPTKDESPLAPAKSERMLELISIPNVIPFDAGTRGRGKRTRYIDHGTELAGLSGDDHYTYYRHDGGRDLSGSVPIGAAIRDFIYTDDVVLRLEGSTGAVGVRIGGATTTPFIAPHSADDNASMWIGAKGTGKLQLDDVRFVGDLQTYNLNSLNFNMYRINGDTTLYLKNTGSVGGSWVANLDVEGSINVGGDLTLGGMLAASSVEVDEIGTATYDDVQNFIDLGWGSGVISGCEVTENSSLDGTVDIAAGTGWIRDADSATSNVKFFDIAATSGMALTDDGVNYVYIDYNSGTPQVASTQTVSVLTGQTFMVIALVTRDAGHVHIVNAGQHVSDMHNKITRRYVWTDFTAWSSGLAIAGSDEAGYALGATVTAGKFWVVLKEVDTGSIDTGHNHDITVVNQGTKTFTVAGDQTGHLTSHGDHYMVMGSTGNDGTYTIQSVSYTGGNTEIVTEEAIPNAVADGMIHDQVIHAWHRDGGGDWTATHLIAMDVTHYDDGDGTLGDLLANRFAANWMFMDFDGHLHMLYGQGNYTSSQADAATLPSGLPPVLSGFSIPIAKIIIQKDETDLDNATILTPFAAPFAQSATTVHHDLAGLSDDDHTLYLLADGTRDVTDDMLFVDDKMLQFRGVSGGIKSEGVSDLTVQSQTNLYLKSTAIQCEVSGVSQLRAESGVVTIGGGAAGVDYRLVFDGENDNGTITWKEDESQFYIDAAALYVPGNITAVGLITAGGNLTVGSGTAGVDYILGFIGETNSGFITFMEDEARFDFDQAVDVAGNITLAGTVDGRDVAADGAVLDTAITADANLTDDYLVRGKGGLRGAQTSLGSLNDAGEMGGLTKLTVDNIVLNTSTLSIVGGTDLIFLPATGSCVQVLVRGTDSADQDALQLVNRVWDATMIDTRTSLVFRQAYNVGGDLSDSGRITVHTETNWGAPATLDSAMSFHTVLDGVVTEQVRINSAGAVGINTTDPGGIFGSALLDIRNDARCSLALITYSDVATTDSRVFAARARGAEGAEAAVQDDDVLFLFQAIGYDTVGAWKTAAYIQFDVDGVVGAGTVPGAISFWTTTAAAPALRMTIQGDGDVLFDVGTSVFVRDSALGWNSSVDGQFDVFADGEIELTAPIIDLNAASIFASTLASGTDQADAGVAAGELYVDTNDDNTVKRGV